MAREVNELKLNLSLNWKIKVPLEGSSLKDDISNWGGMSGSFKFLIAYLPFFYSLILMDCQS